MSKKPIQNAVLFLTSAGSDVQCSGGNVTIAGLSGGSVSKKEITGVFQQTYKPEVVQVVTVSTTAAPVASTEYKIAVYDPLRKDLSYNESPKVYKYRTSSTLALEGGSASLQREYINAQLISKINSDPSNHATAVTLGSGNGFTVTDAGGYYPVFSQSMTNIKGVNKVYTITNSDGTGFADNLANVTTAAVLSSGVGARLAAQAPVVSAVFNNLISGVLMAPPLTVNRQPAVAGQNYDAFIITSLKPVQAIPVGGQQALQDRTQTIWVDNGTGTSTSNLAGFIAFKTEMLRILFGTYESDPATIYDFFDNGLNASATYPTTGLPVSTTDNVVMSASSSDSKFTWYVNPIGAHTIITPIVGAAGLNLGLDVVTQEGAELSAPNTTQCPKQGIVGKAEMSFYGSLNIGAAIAATSFKTLSFGLRKKGAYAVSQTAYEAASIATAALGVPLDTGVAPVINVITGPGTAGSLTNTSTAIAPAANAVIDFYITVDINGSAKFYVNGINKTPAAGYTFAAGTVLMPFASFSHGAAANASPSLTQAGFVSGIWRG